MIFQQQPATQSNFLGTQQPAAQSNLFGAQQPATQQPAAQAQAQQQPQPQDIWSRVKYGGFTPGEDQKYTSFLFPYVAAPLPVKLAYDKKHSKKESSGGSLRQQKCDSDSLVSPPDMDPSTFANVSLIGPSAASSLNVYQVAPPNASNKTNNNNNNNDNSNSKTTLEDSGLFEGDFSTLDPILVERWAAGEFDGMINAATN